MYLFADDGDLLKEGNPHLQGMESFDTMLTCMGLTDRLPIPDPVTFLETDPLGSKVLQTSGNSQDIVSSISKLYLLYLSYNCVPCTMHRGYHGLFIIMSPHPQTLSHSHQKNEDLMIVMVAG